MNPFARHPSPPCRVAVFRSRGNDAGSAGYDAAARRRVGRAHRYDRFELRVRNIERAYAKKPSE